MIRIVYKYTHILMHKENLINYIQYIETHVSTEYAQNYAYARLINETPNVYTCEKL